MKHLLLAALLLAGGCSAMPGAHGDHTSLMPGIDEPRDLADMEIREHPMPPLTVSLKCAQLYARHGYWGHAFLAAMPFGWVSQHGCSFTPWGNQVPKDGEIWCDIVYPIGVEWIRLAELEHCKGYDHRDPGYEVVPTVTAQR